MFHAMTHDSTTRLRERESAADAVGRASPRGCQRHVGDTLSDLGIGHAEKVANGRHIGR